MLMFCAGIMATHVVDNGRTWLISNVTKRSSAINQAT